MATLFGPSSAVWVLHGDAAGLIGGLRALAVQALEPRALAGVDQFSRFQNDPDRRLAETVDFVDVITYGTLEEVDAAIERVRRLHEGVRGVDPVSGMPFDANDPELLAFVHDSLVASVSVAYRTLHPGAPTSLLDTYTTEMRRFAERMGADLGLVPADFAGCVRLVESWPTLTVSPAFRRAFEVLEALHVEGPVQMVWPAVMHWVRHSLPTWVRVALEVEEDPVGDAVAWVLLELATRIGRVIVPPSPRRLAALGVA
ncbi:conserved hypothetical protein [Acidimicrobium ferrooxidans DSM 10331]|uniref:ER-bound oxygenase mpaB/mpaB'/Rubber oxygenase catalytic domain-containing protein n=1 Tax=Acidimicrobium ferrooxidans (strain DSM 10331 / JCM 15462 / NBRC 103882 / ICP) TaxID=525909 RepID=C7LXW0_ACIFD|nr:oxygenase MpaB family protein [Acidimicrobium ferrooxidans]ACU53568.1 conserved hypothetical protein [Acidimicrobium ferrooxidans DSM 10331]